MRWLVVYWTIGCLIAGGGMAGMVTACPHSDLDLDPKTIVLVAATWPASLAMALTLPSGHVFPPPKCQARTE
jgi:hypothetical protein